MSHCLITFDLNTTELTTFIENNREYLGFSTVNNCYNIISKKLYQHGFKKIQGSVYETDKQVGFGGTQADGTLAIQELTRENIWFTPHYVPDIRFLEIFDDYNALHIIEKEVQECELARKRAKLLFERLSKLGLDQVQIFELLKVEFPEQLQNPTLLKSIRVIPSSKKEDEEDEQDELFTE